jgi:hypothetical protein
MDNNGIFMDRTCLDKVGSYMRKDGTYIDKDGTCMNKDGNYID